MEQIRNFRYWSTQSSILFTSSSSTQNYWGNLGPLGYLLNTTSHHRVHHGANRYCLDKNYDGWLSVWDRVFGNFQEELPGETIEYGLVDQLEILVCNYLDEISIKHTLLVTKIFHSYQAMAVSQALKTKFLKN